MQIHGPVPSRRLGKSPGVNNVPGKTCTYSCAYCPVGNLENDLLSITAVHPLREEAVMAMAEKAGHSLAPLNNLLSKGRLKKVRYGEHVYYLRKHEKPF
jgi:hypothetical protein